MYTVSAFEKKKMCFLIKLQIGVFSPCSGKNGTLFKSLT